MNKSFEVFKLIVRLWYRSIQKVLNTRIKIVSSVFVFIVLLFLAAIVGYKLTSDTLGSFLNGDERMLHLLTLSIFLNSSLLVFGLFIFFKSITPDQSQFTKQLHWLPLKGYERNLGYEMPIIAVIAAITLFIDSILVLPSFIMAKLNIEIALLFFGLLLCQTLFTSFVLSAFYNTLTFVVSKVKVPFRKFITLLVLMLCTFFYMSRTFNLKTLGSSFEDFNYNLSYLFSPLVVKLTSGKAFANVSSWLIFAFFLTAALCFLFSLLLLETAVENRASKLFDFIPISKRNKAAAILAKEIKVQSRNEENVLNFLIFTSICLFLRLQFDVSSSNSTILLILAGLTGIFSLNSFGNEQSFFPLYKIFLVRPMTIMLSKLAGLVLLALVNLVWLSLLLNVTALDLVFFKNALTLLNSVVIFYIVGLIIPIGKKNPYTGAFAFAGLIFILMPVAFLLTYSLADVSAFALIVLLIAFEVILGAALIYVSNWRLKYG